MQIFAVRSEECKTLLINSLILTNHFLVDVKAAQRLPQPRDGLLIHATRGALPNEKVGRTAQHRLKSQKEKKEERERRGIFKDLESFS